MKKLFTLIALLTCFLGARAEWVQDYKIEYSSFNDFPHYIMGYAPTIENGVMVDNPEPYRKIWRGNEDDYPGDDGMEDVTINGASYKQQSLDSNPWRQYFIATGIKTEIDGTYTVKAMVKASQEVTINVDMRWSWGENPVSTSVKIGTEWKEVEWEHSGIGGNSCDLIAQPGVTDAVIEWKYIIVGHNAKAQKPITWLESIENGDAEKTWASMGLGDVTYDDMDNNYKICAWGKERMVNQGDPDPETGNPTWNPFPATIEVDPAKASNHCFVVHGKEAITEGDPSAWDNQFWIQSPKSWKSGEQVKIKFRYKASKNVTVATQSHFQMPSNYNIWYFIGDINFTTEWQTFEETVTIPADDTWSVAFQLNQNDKAAIDFYFDDLSWSEMKLEHGYYAAGANTAEGIDYDLDNAIEFTDDADEGCLSAVVGTKKEYVDEIMVSTVRGNDQAYKSNTLKPEHAVTMEGLDDWIPYAAGSLAKIKLPGAGIWKVYLDLDYTSMAFVMLEGKVKEKVDIVTNPGPIVINAVERDWLTADNDGNPREEEVGEGQTWDNQFWIVANRVLQANEETVLEFDYVATTEAGTTTGTHASPGDYRKNAIPDFTFTTSEQHLKTDYVVPAAGWDGSAITDAQSIAFDLACIKGANTYTIKNVKWYLKDASNDEGKTTENLIKATGTDNFFIKVGAGNAPVQAGISSVVNDQKVPAVTYNLAGQRVNKNYKGIVVTKGKKYLVK